VQSDIFVRAGVKMASINDPIVEQWAILMLKSLGCTSATWQQKVKKAAKEFVVREVNNHKEKMKQRYRNNLKARKC